MLETLQEIEELAGGTWDRLGTYAKADRRRELSKMWELRRGWISRKNKSKTDLRCVPFLMLLRAIAE
jgi:hypothetical protein